MRPANIEVPTSHRYERYEFKLSYHGGMVKPTPSLDRALAQAAEEHDKRKVWESQGPNDSPRIREYLALCGITKPAPWCAAFVFFCLLAVGYKRATLPSHPASTWYWKEWAGSKGLLTQDWSRALRGDLFVWNVKGQGHIGWVVECRKIGGVWWVRTIEGNSNDGGSREGTKVVRRGIQGKLAPLGWRRVTSRMFLIRMNAWRPE